MNDCMKKWERETGVQFLRTVGLKPGQSVLDFGACNGHYSIPAAQVVGPSGLVCAVDKDEYELCRLHQKAKELNLHHVRINNTKGRLVLNFIKV